MRVVWTRPALQDLSDIRDYIAQDSPKAAYSVARRIRDRTNDQLSHSPMTGRVGYRPGTRELVLIDLPYIVIYRVKERVEIAAVLHSSRGWPADPE